MKKAALVLVVVALGVAGGYAGRPFAEPYVGGPREIEAEVVAERTEDSRLVLTLRAGEETMLATFHRRTEDIAELVEPGDTIALRTRADGAFADDADVLAVRRPAPVEGDDEGHGEHEEDEGDVEHEDERHGEVGAEPEPEEAAHAAEAGDDPAAGHDGVERPSTSTEEAVAIEASPASVERPRHHTEPGHPPS